MGRPLGSVEHEARPKSARPALWRVIRFCFKTNAHFTLKDLEAATGRGGYAPRLFVKDLQKAGLVECIGRGPAGIKFWRLVRDIGPRCPIRRGGRLFDPNAKPNAKPSETQRNKRTAFDKYLEIEKNQGAAAAGRFLASFLDEYLEIEKNQGAAAAARFLYSFYGSPDKAPAKTAAKGKAPAKAPGRVPEGRRASGAAKGQGDREKPR